jgi:NADH dehydrogenase
VFVVGDMISLDHLPGVAQVAIQGAKYAAKEIDRRIKGKEPQGPFKYFDKGDMATIARFKAIARIRKLRITGVVAWLMWLVVHLFYLTGFKNRVTALVHWFVTFVSNDRSERTATEQQIFARLALERIEGGATQFVSSPDGNGEDSSPQDRNRLEEIAEEEARLTDSGARGRASA